MINHRPDFLVLGSGFGGSLLALILARAGKTVVMIDRSRHPRFAIGESSTPLADRTLAMLADRYGLPELRPLCHWGSWKRMYPALRCGKKRGFTYFDQTGTEDFSLAGFDSRRLLVSASVDDEHSDTHWLRSDVDQFLFELAQSAGVIVIQECRYMLTLDDKVWRVQGESADQVSFAVEAPFAIDATGSASAVLKVLAVPEQTHVLRTNSRSLFAHFGSVASCERVLSENFISVEAFPYRCDDAAVHHVLPDGWMWQLRFDDDSLSAGFMIDERAAAVARREPMLHSSAAGEWDARISRTAFLSRQFENATIVRPESGLQVTKRIQRLATKGAGSNWAALANTVGFIDPLHSTGIAHTLFSVSRLADTLLSQCESTERRTRLEEYSDTLIREIRCVDEFVEGCYESIPSFRLWCLWSMLYFTAVTSMENSTGDGSHAVSFLRADDGQFRSLLSEARRRLAVASNANASEQARACADFQEWLRGAVEPWNHVGLFDDTCNGLYSSTAAPADLW